MPEIPSFKSPTVPTLPNLSLSGASGATLPSTTALSSIGTSVPSIPSVGGIGQSLTSNIPDAGALKSAVPTFSAPSLPTDLASSTQTQLAAKIPKFDSKIDLPEVETGKLGLLSSPTDLGAFKEKTMSSLSSMVPPFTPGVKISALNDLADKKSALMSSLKSAAGGALGAAAGGALGAAAGVALSGGNLKNIAKSALGGAVGGAVGNLASQAGLKGNIAGALGSAAGTLATGGNLKNAAMSAGGGLVASTLTSKLGGGVIASSVGAFAGAKISGASTKSSIVGGLTAGAGAFAAQKIFSISSAPTAGATTVAEKTANIPSNVELVTATNSKPESMPQSIPPPSPIATIDEDTGKVVLSNTDPANLTTVKETVIGGGSKTTYADKYNPDTGKYEPVPSKIEPSTKKVTTTVVNKSTGEVISSGTESTEITAKQAKKETNSKNLSPPREAVKTKSAPIILPRPISPVYILNTDIYGNESLTLSNKNESIIPIDSVLVSMTGTKDILTLKYADGSKTEVYNAASSIQKFGHGSDESDTITVDTLADGKTSMYSTNEMSKDYSLPSDESSPYFMKNPDGSITYTFSDGTIATEMPSGAKSLFTINGVSAEIDIPTQVQPSTLEIPSDQLEKSKEFRKKIWTEKNYGRNKKDNDGNYIKEKMVIKTDENGNPLFSSINNGVKSLVKESKKENGAANYPAFEFLPDGTVSQYEVNSQFEKEWNDTIVKEVKNQYSKKLADKYEALNRGEQVKTAESIDKMHIIEVTRSGFRAKRESYKVMKVRVYKKTEEVP
jgi:hypothetical protein